MTLRSDGTYLFYCSQYIYGIIWSPSFYQFRYALATTRELTSTFYTDTLAGNSYEDSFPPLPTKESQLYLPYSPTNKRWLIHFLSGTDQSQSHMIIIHLHVTSSIHSIRAQNFYILCNLVRVYSETHSQWCFASSQQEMTCLFVY